MSGKGQGDAKDIFEGRVTEKRISKGLALCIALKILYGIIGLFIASGAYLGVLGSEGASLPQKMFLALFPLCFIVYLAVCFFLIRLKNWARWVSIVFDSAIILSVLPPLFKGISHYGTTFFTDEDMWVGLAASVLPLIILLWSIYYLTRPKVRGQFD